MSQYVQHISGQGEKWEMDDCASTPYMWRVNEPRLKFWFDLPKSEYRLCDPPERWVDVTGECELTERWCGGHPKLTRAGESIRSDGVGDGGSYRLRKVRLHDNPQISTAFHDPDGKPIISTEPRWAFIVERREP